MKLDEDSVNEISAVLNKYGMANLVVEFTAMLSTTAQSIPVVLRFLEIAKQLLCSPSDVRCSNSSSNTVERGDVLWYSLVQILVKRMNKSHNIRKVQMCTANLEELRKLRRILGAAQA